jgi:uncharacterized protein YecE (DUF72 family)
VTDKPKVAEIVPGTLPLFRTPEEATEWQYVDRPFSVPGLRIGTSAFTAAGWEGSFYPSRLQPRDYLGYYATKFNTVEIDSTFYRSPSLSTVRSWCGRTPPDFIFAAKFPRVVTHEKVLLNCDKESEEFVGTMSLLGDKLGPLLLQFPFFKETDFSQADFLVRLQFFLKRFGGTNTRYAIEMRNKRWLDQRFADLLREHGIALVLQDQGWMPRPQQLKFDYVTANFVYVRLLGDRKGIEEVTTVWDKVVVDRSAELQNWVSVCQETVRRGLPTFVYANNHYQGS